MGGVSQGGGPPHQRQRKGRRDSIRPIRLTVTLGLKIGANIPKSHFFLIALHEGLMTKEVFLLSAKFLFDARENVRCGCIDLSAKVVGKHKKKTNPITNILLLRCLGKCFVHCLQPLADLTDIVWRNIDTCYEQV